MFKNSTALLNRVAVVVATNLLMVVTDKFANLKHCRPKAHFAVLNPRHFAVLQTPGAGFSVDNPDFYFASAEALPVTLHNFSKTISQRLGKYDGDAPLDGAEWDAAALEVDIEYAELDAIEWHGQDASEADCLA